MKKLFNRRLRLRLSTLRWSEVKNVDRRSSSAFRRKRNDEFTAPLVWTFPRIRRQKLLSVSLRKSFKSIVPGRRTRMWKDFFDGLARLRESRKSFVVATVMKVSGSTYRRPGARV